ncbi:MAG: cytochrome P450 [Polyangiaceae bacterium]
MRGNPLQRKVVFRDGIPVLPGRYPLLGHGWVFSADLLSLLRGGHADLGPLFWINPFLDRWMLICGGSSVFEILRSKSVSNAYLRDEKAGNLIVGSAILSLDGAAHQHVRSAMNPPFAPRGLQNGSFGQVMASVFSARTGAWCARGTIPVLDEVKEASLEVVFRMVGVPTDELSVWRGHFLPFLRGAFAPPFLIPGTPLYRTAQARKWLDEHILQIVRRARESEETGTILASLIHAKDENGEPLSDAELVDNLRFLFVAGHDTTAAVMSWILIELARDPQLWDQLCAEALAAPDVPRSPREAQAFPVAEALFREAARMYAPVTLTNRRTVAPMTLHGHEVPVGALLGVSPALACRDPDAYADPDTFRPARWLGRREPPTSYELMAFGSGPHFCMGYPLAWLESVLFAVTLARKASEVGVRPRLASGSPPPRQVYNASSGHPAPDIRVDFAA